MISSITYRLSSMIMRDSFPFCIRFAFLCAVIKPRIIIKKAILGTSIVSIRIYFVLVAYFSISQMYVVLPKKIYCVFCKCYLLYKNINTVIFFLKYFEKVTV